MHNKEERWLAIAKAPNYDISSFGRVRNGKRCRVLSPFKNNRGYLQIRLFDVDGNAWRPTVHRLVAAAFLGDSDLEVNHKDLDKSNNCVENLEYVTRSQNMIHASVNGVWQGHNPHAAKLTAEQVLQIRQASEQGSGYLKLSRLFSVDKSNIAAIVKRRSWRHI